MRIHGLLAFIAALFAALPVSGSAAPGARYIDLAGQTGGIFASICSDFNESLETLSITAAGLKRAA